MHRHHRRPLPWLPVDVVTRYGRDYRWLRLHGRLVGVQLGRKLLIVKPLHERAEARCGQHPTYHAPWESHWR